MVESIHWTGLLDWIIGLDYWTGLLDWITGLEYWTHINIAQTYFLSTNTFFQPLKVNTYHGARALVILKKKIIF